MSRPPRPQVDLEPIRAALKDRAEDVARFCLGEPNSHRSTQGELRFGRKGSVAVTTVGDKAGLWFDFAEDLGGDLLDLIKRTNGGDFSAAVATAVDLIGGRLEPQKPRRAAIPADCGKLRTIALAKQLWRQSVPPWGTPVESYLRRRRLFIPAGCKAIRFYPACPRERDRVPAMVAAMRSIRSGELVGIHRTYLAADGSKAKRDDDDPAKAMLGHAGVIMLDDFAEVTGGLFVSEGIENALVARCNGWGPVWALGSSGAVKRFPVLAGIESLTILADADRDGREAARLCGERWAEAGAEVRIVEPLAEGADWADALMAARQ